MIDHNTSSGFTFSTSWSEWIDGQKPHEDCVEMDEGETKAQARLQPCGPSLATPVHSLAYQAQQLEAGKVREWPFPFTTLAALTLYLWYLVKE